MTALETLKPRVIQYENSKGGFSGTQSDIAFLRLKKNLDEWYRDTTQKQKETKELLVSFALYMEGTKQPEHLAAQRNFLRTRYDRSALVSRENAQRFVSLLADMAEFRRYYWSSKGTEELGLYHSEPSLGQVRLLMSFVRDMQTKLALPILGRYWASDLKGQGDGEFLDVLKAVTAFLILRRAASGGTAGIDGDLRSIMAPRNGSSKRFGLCAGIENARQRLSVEELKDAFRKQLAASKFKIGQKDKWVDQVVDNPLYQQTRTVARFMLLVAGHQSIPSSKEPGCWKREGVKTSTHSNNFLTHETWNGELYETVEHIAPENEPKSGWNVEIYQNMILRHTLGNLVLLSKKENGAIGNDSWKRKRVFYMALTEHTDEQQQLRIDEGRALGMMFSNYTTQLLQQGERLSLLDPLRDVKEWNREVIKTRARNTAELTWDYLWPWLN